MKSQRAYRTGRQGTIIARQIGRYPGVEYAGILIKQVARYEREARNV